MRGLVVGGRLFAATAARALLVLLALSGTVAGCGRVYFDARTDASSGGSTDDVLVPDGPDGPSVCNFDLCEDFESPIDTSLWTIDPAVTLDTTVVHRGTASAHMHTDALAAGQEAAALLLETRTFQTMPSQIYVRAWVRLVDLPAGTNAAELISLEQAGDPDDGNYVFVRNNDVALYNQFQDRTAVSSLPPLGTWFCVLFEIDRSTTNTGALRLRSDVLASADIENTQTDGDPPLGDLAIGIIFQPGNVDVPQPAFDVWIDDVIVHSAPVTCAD